MMSSGGSGPGLSSPATPPMTGPTGQPGQVGQPQPPPPYPGYLASPASSAAASPGKCKKVEAQFWSCFFHSLASKDRLAIHYVMHGSGPVGASSKLPAGAAPTPGPSASSSLYKDQDNKQNSRFQVELEFVQCLGNPNYLHFLAQRGYFKDEKFINYLDYLQYWKDPKYVKHLKYPVCLHFLELLQHDSFRKEIVNGQCAKFLDDQVILNWQHYTRKRIKLIETAAAQQQQNVQGTPNSQSQSQAQGQAQASNKL